MKKNNKLSNRSLSIFVTILCVFSFIAGISFYQYLQYDFKTLDGKQYKHKDFNETIVLVNYFAEWCAPCLREIPELNAFSAQAPEDVQLFAISYDELSPERISQLQIKYNIQFPLITEIHQAFPFEKPAFLPATYVIKANGEVAGKLMGEQTIETLNKAINEIR